MSLVRDLDCHSVHRENQLALFEVGTNLFPKKNELLPTFQNDIPIYGTTQGQAVFSAIEGQPIIRSFGPDWAFEGDDGEILCFELLGRFKTDKPPHANCFPAFMFGQLDYAKKMEYTKANLEVRRTSRVEKYNVNVPPEYWASIASNDENFYVLVNSLKVEDFPEVQELSFDNKVLEKHSTETKDGIWRYYNKTGRCVSIDDWSLGVFCNDTSFIVEMCKAIKQVKIDIKLSMALFNVTLTPEQSPGSKFLNEKAKELLDKHEGLDALRSKALEEIKTILENKPEMLFVVEITVGQVEIDSWPEFKALLDPLRTSFQGGKFYSRTFTIAQIEQSCKPAQ